MKNLMNEDKSKGTLVLLWLLTVFSSFTGDAFFSIDISGIGTIFPFRVLLPITAILYIVWTVQNKSNIWADSYIIERLCWLLAAIMLLHSIVSLPFAIDISFSFRRLFNLAFDLCFFLLAMRLCREQKILHYTLICAGTAGFLLCIAGVYEIFNGGIFNDAYDKYIDFEFLGIAGQFPVVTYTNTNDFISELVFILGIILLYWGYAYLEGKRRFWVPFALFPLFYFVTRAARGRLVALAIWILLFALFLFVLIEDKKRTVIPMVILVLILGINLTSGYIGPGAGSRVPLGEELLNSNASGGIRLRLLQHSLDCFVDSWGMGVGIGNTEQLARLTIADDIRGIWSIHCFVARIIADYGIWVLLPFSAIAFCLVIRGMRLILVAIRSKNRKVGAIAVLYLSVLIIYPFVSTASSDAQDLLAMWLYLAMLCIFSGLYLPIDNQSNTTGVIL